MLFPGDVDVKVSVISSTNVSGAFGCEILHLQVGFEDEASPSWISRWPKMAEMFRN